MADVIIIGDGPAGLAAALYLAKNGMTVEVYGKNETWMHKALVLNYLGISRITGPEFMRAARAQVEAFGASLIDAEVTDVRVVDGGFEIDSRDGQGSSARYIVITAGPKTGLGALAGLGLTLDEKGFVAADRNGRTNVDKLYVAGWSTRPDKIQAQISAGDGAAAALDILSREKGKDFHDFDVLS
jgi:thioredoxin reductase (NADPH)